MWEGGPRKREGGGSRWGWVGDADVGARVDILVLYHENDRGYGQHRTSRAGDDVTRAADQMAISYGLSVDIDSLLSKRHA